MPQPTDAEASRELKNAARLFAALAAGFLAVTGVSVSVAARAPTMAQEAMGATLFRNVDPVPIPGAVPDTSDPDVIEIEMGEFFFAPGEVSVPVGVPVTFSVVNPGVVDHELVIGDGTAQDEAEAAMRSGSGHAAHGAAGHHGEDVPSIYLRPGESGELTVTFSKKGDLLIGCHVPGHWAAGMRGTLQVG